MKFEGPGSCKDTLTCRLEQLSDYYLLYRHITEAPQGGRLLQFAYILFHQTFCHQYSLMVASHFRLQMQFFPNPISGEHNSTVDANVTII